MQNVFGQSSVIAATDKYLPWIDTEAAALGGDYSKVFIGGASLGCGMSKALLERYSMS